MFANLLPLLSYVLISTFTPGPSNITSASMGVLHGYRNTLKLQLGLATGVLIVMLASGAISTTLLQIFPILEPVLRYAGAAYILYLAYSLLRANYVFAERDSQPLGFLPGFVLQILNPKLTVYAFTLFSAFLAPVTGNLLLLALVAILLAAISFGATSVWALFGTGIKVRLENPRLKTIFNVVLSLSLVYAAVALLGIV
jgi:cysteine/O-acetylserine efflux protein